ncbi:BspA family leucine-rich repeat surface protein [Mycoplasma mycoides]|uniref:BspA family leucine-rich repeat surface protein n=1 Tax=Mycoplasma mycoides TaxID=2102 RepID=UPI002736F29F|nr:BspA family leucine-rich repeat surface protein [Mycoplasma mycoides]MDP4040040.1 BspA family leucine-rich repeat surface protein [Mycoplasma mycoides]MDP4040996.1 BspA family leucine-rich repeat surface protein [Mycoplasma mycoides]MDP4041801.1 BspA family leucine-rich repeat surface protein [Mycoplasma mycoides]MDP4043421.1 BspA family leucine-rich repeat surface protein [Mycoplasma mycoides]MDP4044288.1 BspA family leucine-rich repeat surface protein [Mycoplasma mycoides]
MKKILTLFSSLAMISTTGFLVVACNNTNNNPVKSEVIINNKQAVIDLWNKEFKNKLDSAKNTSLIVEMLKEKLPKKISDSIDLNGSLYENTVSKLTKDENNKLNQKVKVLVNKDVIELEVGSVKYGQQSIKYKTKDGKIVEKNKDEWEKMVWKDPSKKRQKQEISDIDEVVQMGYYDDEGENYLKPFNKNIHYVQAFEMPKNISKISALLPREVNSLSKVFYQITSTNVDGIEKWDVSRVCQMSFLFDGAKNFNHDISNWDVKILRDANSMFADNAKFNQNLGKWKPYNLAFARKMFARAKEFNQDLSSWQTSHVYNMEQMFDGAEKFNSNLDKWDTSHVESMKQMFSDAKAFNGNISSWNTTNVKTMASMFRRAKNFSQDISKWDTKKVVDMSNMFSEAEKFNSNISKWDVSNVTNMNFMFNKASSFDQNLSEWKVNEKVKHNNFEKGSKIDNKMEKLPKFKDSSSSTSMKPDMMPTTTPLTPPVAAKPAPKLKMK